MSECKDCRWFVDEQVTFTVPKCAMLDRYTVDARKVCAGELFQVPPPRVPATTDIFGNFLDGVHVLRSDLKARGKHLPTRREQWKPAGIFIDTKIYGGLR